MSDYDEIKRELAVFRRIEVLLGRRLQTALAPAIMGSLFVLFLGRQAGEADAQETGAASKPLEVRMYARRARTALSGPRCSSAARPARRFLSAAETSLSYLLCLPAAIAAGEKPGARV